MKIQGKKRLNFIKPQTKVKLCFFCFEFNKILLYYFYFVIFILIYSNKDILLFYRLISEGLPLDVLDTVANLLEDFEENPKGKFF